MNTSIVIPLAAPPQGSRWNDTELRYCLRSIEKHLKGCGEIFIVGYLPNWVQNVIHIPATDGDKSYEKEANIFRKLEQACKDERISEYFLFVNDDHFLLQDYDAGDFPFFYSGKLSEVLTRGDEYASTGFNTFDALEEQLYFDIHCPIIYHKEILRNKVSRLNWSKKYGYCIKTAYMTGTDENEVNVKEMPDLKINEEGITSTEIKKLIEGRPWFSIGPKAQYGGMLKVLQDLYPLKSKYEK